MICSEKFGETPYGADRHCVVKSELEWEPLQKEGDGPGNVLENNVIPREDMNEEKIKL